MISLPVGFPSHRCSKVSKEQGGGSQEYWYKSLHHPAHHSSNINALALLASDLMYDFAEIRQVVLAHDRFHNRDLNLFQRWQRGIVEYSEPELIGLRSTNESAHDEQPSFTGVHITHSVSAADLLKFLQKNRQYFLPGSVRFDRKGKNYIPLEIEETLSAFIQYDDAEIIEFDDEFEAKELVYSIVLNKTSKRITVLFRGSTTANDWRANTALQPVRFPEVFQKMVNDENVKVHGGFAGELLRTCTRTIFNIVVYFIARTYRTGSLTSTSFFFRILLHYATTRLHFWTHERRQFKI